MRRVAPAIRGSTRNAAHGRYLWRRVAIVALAGSASSFLFAAAALSSAWYPSGQQAPDLSTPKGLYEAGCRYCHAADGRGVDLSTVAFDTPLPDFTDCSFATREPDADWFIVTHQGGPIRGFDQSMPAYHEAFTDEQIEMVVGYLRVFCADDRWPRGELNYPRAIVTEKAYPEDELVFTVGANADGPGGVAGEFLYEKRLLAAGQFELAVPVGMRQLETDGA
jgi:mono/diheme cytochrome c family protein